jgi:hypothetical protein
MSKRVLFNGAVLVRPGASTKIDASQFQNVILSGSGIVGLIGEANGGQPRTVQVFNSPAGVKAFYKTGDLVEAAAIAAAPGLDPRIAAGASTIVTYKVNNSVAASFTHAATLLFKAKQYGVATNSITVELALGASANERIVKVTDLDEYGALVSEQSPSLGATGKFSIQYTGAATVCTMTITGTTLATTTSVAAIPADDLAFNFADYPTLTALVQAIDNHPNYACTALVSNGNAFAPANLDAVVAASVMTLTSVFSRNFDVADWINTNSAIISATLTPGLVGPTVVLAKTSLTGGTRGTSANSDWVNGFTALRGVRINQLVPLVSQDATTSQGTFTFLSVMAAAAAHGAFVSSTIGRNEGQIWIGANATKTGLITNANLINSEHVCLVGQKNKLQRSSDGALVFFEEWATAVGLAGMRAGAPLGEPLTFKYLKSFGVSSDASWSEANNDDVTDLALNGVIVVNELKGRGFRIDKCITTFGKLDNDAYTEETIVQTWKAMAYDIRVATEDAFVGRPGSLRTVRLVPSVVGRICELYRTAGAITDSNEGGQTVLAYRAISVSLDGDRLYVGLIISPTPGINFLLNTITLIPAKISL